MFCLFVLLQCQGTIGIDQEMDWIGTESKISQDL